MWTFQYINNVNGKWVVPEILKDGDVREFEDALTALQFAEWKCSEYHKAHKDRTKVPVINSALHTTSGKEQVQLGDKAKSRLNIRQDMSKQRVYNIIILTGRSENGATHVRGFGQVVGRNGETQSVMTGTVLPNGSTRVPDGVAWTNFTVQEMKRRLGYPINSFFPEEERVDSFLSQSPVTSPPSSETPYKHFKDSIRNSISGRVSGFDAGSMADTPLTFSPQPIQYNVDLDRDGNPIFRPLHFSHSYGMDGNQAQGHIDRVAGSLGVLSRYFTMPEPPSVDPVPPPETPRFQGLNVIEQGWAERPTLTPDEHRRLYYGEWLQPPVREETLGQMLARVLREREEKEGDQDDETFDPTE